MEVFLSNWQIAMMHMKAEVGCVVLSQFIINNFLRNDN